MAGTPINSGSPANCSGKSLIFYKQAIYMIVMFLNLKSLTRGVWNYYNNQIVVKSSWMTIK